MCNFRVGDLVAVIHHDAIQCTPTQRHGGDSRMTYDHPLPPIGVPLKIAAINPNVTRYKSGTVKYCGCMSIIFEDGTAASHLRCRRLAKSDDTTQTDTRVPDFRKALRHVPQHA